MPKILAIIPARGGSKSIPRKNLLEVAGHPLISYSIKHGLESRLINRLVVSTDDQEIADVARDFGAEVPFLRPAIYATDSATDLEVFRHALETLRADGYEPDLVVQLRPTDPLRRVEVIDRAIELMLAHPEADSLRSVRVADYTPYKMWRIEQGYLQPLLSVPGLPEAHSMPRQMLPTVYQGSGYVDVLRPRTILEQSSMCGRTILPFPIEEPCFDLDYPEQIPALAAALGRLSTYPKRTTNNIRTYC